MSGRQPKKKSMTALAKFRQMLLRVYGSLEIVNPEKTFTLTRGSYTDFPLTHQSRIMIVKSHVCPKAEAGIQLSVLSRARSFHSAAHCWRSHCEPVLDTEMKVPEKQVS